MQMDLHMVSWVSVSSKFIPSKQFVDWREMSVLVGIMDSPCVRWRPAYH